MKNRTRSKLLLLLFFLSFISSSAFSQKTFFTEPLLKTSRYILENGLTVLITEMPSSSSVSVYTLVKAGSATEGPLLGAGISHFLEHMVFKGTEKRAVGQISKEIQGVGGNINASTGHDFTIYTITVPSNAFDTALDVTADMLMNSSFDPIEIERERTVVHGEMRMRRDWPDSYLGLITFKAVFQQHPYGIPVIGYQELLDRLNRDDFLAYYHAYYIPNNMILSIAGNVDEEEIFPKIEKAFQDFQRQSYVLRNLPQEPPQTTLRRYEEEYPTDLTRMSLNFQGVSARHPDMFALDVLAMILGQGESSRLYHELLKKKKLVQAISAGNYTPTDPGVFDIDVVTTEDKAEQAILAIQKEIQTVAKEGVTPDELEKSKRQVLSDFIYGHQTSGQVAYRRAMDEMIYGDADFSRKYLQKIRDVANEDVKRVAGQYLIADHLTTVILKPKKEKKDVAQESKTSLMGEIQKIEMDNGLTILLRENHTVPLISLHVALQGGLRQETEDKNGLSELTARLWTKGTTTRSAREIIQSVESRGAQFGGFSGKNSFGVSLTILPEDLNFGMDLLADVIKNPTFDKDELLLEKEQVKTAIRALQDNIQYLAGRELRRLLFQTHPLRLDSLGTLESVEKITREDLQNFYRGLLSSRNMVISVFGDFQKEEVARLLQEKFAQLPSMEVSLKTHQEDPPQQGRQKTLHLDKEQAVVMMGFHAVEMSHPDYYAFELLSSILGSSFEGRIFKRIRDQFGQAYTLGGSWATTLDKGMIYFFVATTPDAAVQVQETLKSLIVELQQNLVSEEELKEAKTYLKGSFEMDLETNSALGFMAALDELYGFGYNRFEKYPHGIDQVTAEDIQRLAQEYLDLQKAVVVIALPQQKPSSSP